MLADPNFLHAKAEPSRDVLDVRGLWSNGNRLYGAGRDDHRDRIERGYYGNTDPRRQNSPSRAGEQRGRHVIARPRGSKSNRQIVRARAGPFPPTLPAFRPAGLMWAPPPPARLGS